MQQIYSSDHTATSSKKTETTRIDRKLFLAALAWLFLTACFTYINWHFTGEELFETGDFAANSLLVQDAKQLNLWIGHYSRFGFNHPGPALLYVLAGGEWLLFDYLHLVKSPFAGQILATGAYSAFWLSAIGLLFFRLSSSVSGALVSWAVFAAVTAYVDPTILTGVWPPHLFYLPFATFTLALMRLLTGKGDAFFILALSCGFLFHGHASFLAICILMLGATLVLNMGASLHGGDRICSKRFLSLYRSDVTLAVFTCFLFFLPLLVETLRHFPGPLYKYATYGGGNERNDVGKALVFLAQYWSFGLLPLLTAIFALYFLLANKSTTMNAQHSRKHAPILFVSTAAVLFYAVAGIDSLKMPYLGLFYYSTPALALALMLSAVLPQARLKAAIIAIILTAVALPFIYRQAAKPIGYAALYTDKNIPSYFEKLSAVDSSTIVLDLDQQSDWGHIWSTLVAIEAYAARKGNGQLFCINKNWHILFTEKARCTEDRLQTSQRFFVSTANLADTLGASSVDLEGIGFYKINATALKTGTSYRVADHKTLFAVNLLNKGWSPVDGEFVWSEGKLADVMLKTDVAAIPSSIVLDIGAYLPRKNSKQSATVFANGIEIGTLKFSETNNRASRKLALPSALSGSAFTLRFDIHSPTSPKENKHGRDHRKLGIALYGITLEH